MQDTSLYKRIFYFFTFIGILVYTIQVCFSNIHQLGVWYYYSPDDLWADLFKTIKALELADTWSSTKNTLTYLTFVTPLCVTTMQIGALLFNTHFLNKSHVFSILFILPMLFIFIKNKKELINLPIFFLSYPFIFNMHRANVAFFVFLCLFLFLLYIEKNPFLAILYLGIATSYKITPIIYIIVFWIQYKNNIKNCVQYTLIFICLLFLINFSSLWLNQSYHIHDVYSPKAFKEKLPLYEYLYISLLWGLNGNPSWYMLFFYSLKRFLGYTPKLNHNFISMSAGISLSLLAFLYYFLKGKVYKMKFKSFFRDFFERLDTTQAFLMASLAQFIFLPLMQDYYLLLLLIPFILLKHFHSLKTFQTLLIVLIIVSKGVGRIHGVHPNLYINPPLILGLYLLTLRYLLLGKENFSRFTEGFYTRISSLVSKQLS